LYFGKELNKNTSLTDIPQHPTKGIMSFYPEQLKSSQMISRINLEHISNVSGAFYVQNERIVMEASNKPNAGILFQTRQLGA